MDMVINRFEVFFVKLDPTLGSEIMKTRPCVIISPDSMNKYLGTVLIAPLTSTIRSYPTRLNCTFENKQGQIALDQIRAVDKIRIGNKLGVFEENFNQEICKKLQILFEY